MQDFEIKPNYTFYDLVDIVKALRGEDGCPWDKVQTHQSVRNDFLEEVYEVLDAIDAEDPEMLKEELGDVLLQVVFHCQMEKEVGYFNVDDVADGICKKLIIRHPHVFGDVKVKDTDEVLKNWENIKQETKGQESYSETLESVPKCFPALMRGQKLSKRAARAGLDITASHDIIDLIKSALGDLEMALASENSDKISEDFGELLFKCCEAARIIGINAEESLQQANLRFTETFKTAEQLIRLDGIDIKSLGINELECYWQKAKK